LATAVKPCAALLRGRAFVPRDTEHLSSGLGLPPGIRNDSDATMEAEQLLSAVNDEGVTNTGEGFDLIDVGARDFTGEDWALFKNGVEDAGNLEGDAVQKVRAHDRGIVRAARRLADNLVVLCLLGLDRSQVGRGHGGDF